VIIELVEAKQLQRNVPLSQRAIAVLDAHGSSAVKNGKGKRAKGS
jgi:hypothetical protein